MLLPVKSRALWKLLLPCEQKQTRNPKKKHFFVSKLKTNTKMSDEEHSNREFYYPEKQETAKRNASRHCRHFVGIRYVYIRIITRPGTLYSVALLENCLKITRSLICGKADENNLVNCWRILKICMIFDEC